MTTSDTCCVPPLCKWLAIVGRSGALLALFMLLGDAALATELSVVPTSAMPWWFWPLALFVTCFLIGISS
jgi:hypothetical protein